MSRNGTGTYSLPAGNPVVTNTTVSSTWANNTLNDIATALTASIAGDGQTIPTADLPMGGFTHTNVGDATLRTQYPSFAQVQDNKPAWGGTAGGTADALTLGPSVGVTAYTTGQRFEFIAVSANTITTPTVAVSGLAAKTIVDSAGNAISAGAIQPGLCQIQYDGTNFRLQSLQLTNSISSTSTTTAATANSAKLAYDAGTGYKRCAFNYYKSSSQTSSSVLTFDTAYFTQVGSAYNSGTSVFTAPETGLYVFDVQIAVQLTTSSGSGTFHVQWSLNGSTILQSEMYRPYVPPASTSAFTITSHLLIKLTANDTLTLLRIDTPFTANISAMNGSTFWSGYLMG